MTDHLTRRAMLSGSTVAVAAGTFGALAPSAYATAPAARARPQATPAVTGSNGQTQVYLLGAQGGQTRDAKTGSGLHAGTSVLLMVNGAGYLVDAGVGTLLRLNQAGFSPTVIKNVFVTHQHTDHNADLGNILGFAWTTTDVSSTTPHVMTLWGPPGTRDFVAGWEQSTALSNDDQVDYLGRGVSVQDFLTCNEFPLGGDILTTPVQVMSDANVTVTAIRVSHGSMPSVGYRIKTPDLDIVFSGDRGPGNDPDDPGDVPDNFTSLAAGAQVMFHEIIDIERVLKSIPENEQAYRDHMRYDHSDAQYVGATATAAGVPDLVLYHLVPASPLITPDSRWRSLVSPYYKGTITVGHDLLKVEEPRSVAGNRRPR